MALLASPGAAPKPRCAGPYYNINLIKILIYIGVKGRGFDV